MTTTKNTGPTVRMRFATLGGALVVVSRHGPRPGHPNHLDHSWVCEGCLAVGPHSLISEGAARAEANAHAASCRALPQPQYPA